MLRRLIDECDGQDMVEYALVIAVVAVGSLLALQNFRDAIASVWTVVATNLSGGGS